MSHLAKKMKLRVGHRAAILEAPADYLRELSPLPAGVTISARLAGKFDWVQLFALNKFQVDQLLPRVVSRLKPESLLWISFPKGSSKLQTDLTRDVGWEVLRDIDLKWVTLISVNETWSAFALRPYRAGETRTPPFGIQ